MNVQQLVNKLSDKRMEQLLNASVWRSAKLRGMAWSEAAVDSRSIHEAAELLSPYASCFIKAMLRLFAAMPVDGERLLREVRMDTTLSGAECLMGLTELEEAGILFSVRKVWGESLYFIPTDSFAIWQQTLFACSAEPLSPSDRQGLLDGKLRKVYRPLGRQLLSAFAMLAKNGMELTVKGALHKKTVAKLLQAVDFDEQWLSRFELKWTLREHYPLKAAFILEAGFAFGLLYAEEGTLKWNEAVLGNWLNLKEEKRERQLLEWCLKLLLPAADVSAHIAAALIGMQAGQWYSVQHMEQWLINSQIRAPIAADLNSGAKMPDWYSLFHSFGWLELVDYEISGGTGTLFRWKPSSPLGALSHNTMLEVRRFIIVQPNGEVIAQPDSPFSIRWELELMAEQVSDEQVSIYRIDAATLARSLEFGRTRAAIQSFLEQAAGGDPLPAAFAALLEVWTSRACRTEFAEVVLLRCDNEQMAAFVKNDLSIAPLLMQQLGQTDFIVAKSQINEIRSCLQKAGYPPRKGVQTADSAAERRFPFVAWDERKDVRSAILSEWESCQQTAPFIYEAFPLHHFELNDRASKETYQAFPQWDSVPAMWTKQLRTYHPSTRRELIEQALEWQTPVQLRIESELRSFVPEKLEQQEGGWAVVGLLRDERERQPVRLTPDMWEEMRLVIPGQTEPI
ncbi:helicase-associated domain-containing protein [Paenibacillus prosopidis]|uniref:XPB/Ssl2-like helicase family protein n=1 Tax=Paenibacillus prosopidis TaxID=630520 RepID=A0A368WAB4_9BACL|nr:helicase-associated domain-containing protein [Paenibacillus prosopidis]RCW50013.1 XPB/Ssl2-like helicase family protein [Paenibacillus prosopidis]